MAGAAITERRSGVQTQAIRPESDSCPEGYGECSVQFLTHVMTMTRRGQWNIR
jgi:hypothetical protein